ncbi:serine/threonine-protein phosphatase 4 regulatory subunit 1-like isoform X1 [Photinus pyralis]|uniref:serine/threonine-protein phosphatase 4 regulatory subunit 1-like isoform X1 n=1 Tax=Photinus pyralis TaxID=7054 RepID=UPI0012674F7F|nr:serine/threonine-protein phosphatase 4 regulatory subunit 1-like isoform X1 [Photinus pyralis]
MVPRVLLELFKKAPPDVLTQDLPQIMKILSRMSREDETVIRIDLLEQIPYIAVSAVEYKNRVPNLGPIISEHLLPIVVNNLGDKDNQIRKTAQLSLFFLLEKNLVTRTQAEIQVCPAVLGLSNSDTLMDYHTGSITLMSRLVPFLGREVTERVFLQRFSQLCMSNMFCVRKVCASHFGDFCAVIGKEAYDNVLLPSYLNLCADEIWGVRKACAEVIISVSSACSSAKRRMSLAPVFAKLLQDQSRWVRLSAFESLGPFISTFADPTSTRLAYNNVGELVLVNTDGTEFRITPSYSESNILRSVNELHMLFKEEANKDPTPLDSIWDLMEDPSENAEPTPGESTTESKIQIATDPVTKASADANTKTGASVDINNVFDVQSFDNLLKCLDETVSNWDTEPNVAAQDPFEDWKASNKNAESNDEVRHSKTENENCDISKSRNRAENVDNYNSYNYWYVSPNMPLDPKIVNDESVLRNVDHASTQSTKEDLNYSIEFLTKPSPSQLLENTHNTIPTNTPNTEEKIISDASKNCENFTSNEEHPQQAIVPQVLIDHFVSMTDSNLAQESNNEMAYHCAYSLPAVALTLGSDNWHLLKNTVEVLAANMQYRVRRTVASSLYELAVILGPDIATNSLMPIFEGFIRDLDEVRIGVLKHLAHFLRLISPTIRNFYLPRLEGFLLTDNETNWRFRQELAEQLLLAVPLFCPRDACKHISFLAQELLCDKVAAVREVALLLVTELIRHMSSDPARTSRLLVKLDEKFAHSKRWKLRQSFALLCSKLLTSCALPPEQFANEVMPHFLDLSWDPVANVRLVVARTIAQHIITNEYFSDPNNAHFDGLQTVLRRLQADKDRDVRDCAGFHLSTVVQRVVPASSLL